MNGRNGCHTDRYLCGSVTIEVTYGEKVGDEPRYRAITSDSCISLSHDECMDLCDTLRMMVNEGVV